MIFVFPNYDVGHTHTKIFFVVNLKLKINQGLVFYLSNSPENLGIILKLNRIKCYCIEISWRSKAGNSSYI